MAERYSRVFLLEKNCYAPGCPVLVSAGAILKDNQTGKINGQLKLRNLQEKTIKAVKVKLLCADVVGRAMEEQAEKWYLQLAAKRDEEFGSKDLIPLENSLTGTFSVIVEEVCFADNSVWTGNGMAAKPLPEPKARASFNDAELEKQFGLEFGKDFRTEPAEVEDLWYCACGSLNCSREPTCHNCKRVFSEIHSIDIEALTARKDARVAEEEAEEARKAEAARIAAEEKARAKTEKAKKIKKTAIILASAAAICIATFLLVTKVMIPNSNYKAAIALKDAAQYKEAISAFEAMEGYKDSDAQILACYYDAAMALKDSGEYEQAIRAFSKPQLVGYQDTAEQITACQTGIKDKTYEKAVAYMNAGRYDKAIEKFRKIPGHRDSDAQITACETGIKDKTYEEAVALMNAGEYENAIAQFQTIFDYRDSTAQIALCKTAIKDKAYEEAVALMNAGNYQAAYQAFAEMVGFKDSVEQLMSCKRQLLANAKVGDTVYFGTYEQDNNTANGAEEIEWLVLEKKGNKLLVISKYGLDSQPYNTKYVSVTWEKCTLRRWLNGSFINNAFMAWEEELIVATKVSADKNPKYKTTAGKTTTDKVFLLSIKEANKYFSTDGARKCFPTDYAVAQGAHTHTGTTDATCNWWLRTPGYFTTGTAFVYSYGDVNYAGSRATFSDYAVRPAMWISY